MTSVDHKTSYTKITQIQNGQNTSKAISPKKISKWLIKWQYCEKLALSFSALLKKNWQIKLVFKVRFNDSICENIMK